MGGARSLGAAAWTRRRKSGNGRYMGERQPLPERGGFRGGASG
jgi:hypothetical protein